MTFNHTTGVFGMQFPLYQVDGGGSGGGSGAGAGGGTGAGSGSSSGAGSGQQNIGQGNGQTNSGGAAPNSQPTIHDYDEGMLLRVKGSDKPVKLGDHVKGFQSQFTKASQEAARLKKEIEKRDGELSRIREAATGNRNDPNANAGAEMLSNIESMHFIDGKTMGAVLKDLQGGIKERDMVQLAVLQKLKALESTLSNLNGVHVNQSHETKLKGWLSEGGYDAEDPNTYELADIIYRGYEGENLDDEFPAIFNARWKQMQAAIQKRADRERERKRNLPFTPGRGGNAGPGKAQGLTGKETPKELSNIFWDRFNGGGGSGT